MPDLVVILWVFSYEEFNSGDNSENNIAERDSS
jgi:hypothetical protein